MAESKTAWLHSSPIVATNPKAATPLFPHLARLIRGENLSVTDAEDFFRNLIDPKSDPAQMAAALTALTIKGETAQELAGMARVVRERSVKIRSSA